DIESARIKGPGHGRGHEHEVVINHHVDEIAPIAIQKDACVSAITKRVVINFDVAAGRGLDAVLMLPARVIGDIGNDSVVIDAEAGAIPLKAIRPERVLAARNVNGIVEGPALVISVALKEAISKMVRMRIDNHAPTMIDLEPVDRIGIDHSGTAP